MHCAPHSGPTEATYLADPRAHAAPCREVANGRNGACCSVRRPSWRSRFNSLRAKLRASSPATSLLPRTATMTQTSLTAMVLARFATLAASGVGADPSVDPRIVKAVTDNPRIGRKELLTLTKAALEGGDGPTA